MTKNNQTTPKGWTEKSFQDCFSVAKKLSGIKKSEYGISGKFPVIDQGQNFITAYSNDDKFVQDSLPSIVFGDHTRVIKYINFSYILGNDGTKVFSAKNGYNLRFLYYLLSGLEIPNTGYNRHFKYLENESFRLPLDIKEQQKIAEILGVVDEDIEKTEKVIEETEKLKRGLMRELLAKKDYKIGKFSDLVLIRNEKFDPKQNPSKKYIGLEHLGQNSGMLLNFGESSETQSLKSIFKKGDILFGKLRPYLRKYWKAEFDGVCTTEILVFEPKIETDSNFIFQLIQTDGFINASNSKSFGTKMPRTDWGIISKYRVCIPGPEERKEIGNILSSFDNKIEINKKLKDKLTSLKRGLMQDLLTGKVRTT